MATYDKTHELPQNVEAEAGVLGSLLIDPDAIVIIGALLAPDDFYTEAHRTIYQAIRDLYAAGGAADFITICDDLARKGLLDAVGGTAFVGSLANNVPTSRHAVEYAKIVEEHATRRRLIHAAGKIAGGAYEGHDADDALELATKLLHDVARRRPERDNGSWAATMDEVMAELLDAAEGQGHTLGMPTGFTRLDRHMVALRRKELAYLMARPGVGKTLFGAHVAMANAELCAQEADGCVEWFTMEMSKAQQAKRVLASITGINSRFLRAGFRRPDGSTDKVRLQAVLDAATWSRKQLDGRIFVRDASYTIEGLESQLRKAVLERGCRVALIDYFGLIKAEGNGSKASRTERMTEISQQLKAIARDLDIPVWVLAQANRESAHRDNPRLGLTDFRETGAGEQDADWMFALHCPSDFDPARAYGDASHGIPGDQPFAEMCELSVLKARDGESNVTLPLRRHKATTTLEDWPEGMALPEYEGRPMMAMEAAR